MSSKCEAAYMHAFQYIKKHVFSLECETFTVDYETALQNALRKTYPGSSIVSCWFHFLQAVKLNLSKMPIAYSFIRMNSKARILHRKLQCVPLLPADKILGAYKVIRRGRTIA